MFGLRMCLWMFIPNTDSTIFYVFGGASPSLGIHFLILDMDQTVPNPWCNNASNSNMFDKNVKTVEIVEMWVKP